MNWRFQGEAVATAKTDAKVSGNGSAIFATIIATVAWVAFAIYYTFQKPSAGERHPTIWCLGAAEFGSYLQGVFATIGFFWVALAVYIQSKELQHQRREFEQNRKVMEAQVEEARKQAELLKLQTTLLIKANTEAETLAKFQAHVSLLATRLRQYNNALQFDVGEPGENNNYERQVMTPLSPIAVREKDITDDGDQTLIATTTNALRTATRDYRMKYPNIVLSAKWPYNFVRIFKAMDSCRQEAKMLPETRAVLAEALELNALGEIMDWLKDHTSQLPVDVH